jgi:hypothetical protein
MKVLNKTLTICKPYSVWASLELGPVCEVKTEQVGWAKEENGTLISSLAGDFNMSTIPTSHVHKKHIGWDAK